MRFVARGPGYTILLEDRAAVLRLRRDAVRMDLVEAAQPAARGLEQFSGVSNYLIGNDPAKWHVGVPAYARVEFDGVYPGINLVYYGSQRKLEYDFVVAPGADPNRIRLRFDGARSLRLDSNGDLIVAGPEGEIRQHAPVVYQQANGKRRSVPGRYVLEDGGQVAFRLNEYDRTCPLVIDPKLSFSTYYGGADDDGIFDIAVDSTGSVYATGVSGSSNLPITSGALDTTYAYNKHTGTNGDYISAYAATAFGDAFVAKFSPDGSNLVYATYLGGSSIEGAESIAVNAAGQVAIMGATASLDFPLKNAYSSSFPGGDNMFITVLNAAGNGLVYSTFFGTNTSLAEVFFTGNGIAFDSKGKVVIVGQTAIPENGGANTLPLRNAVQSKFGGGSWDAFVAKFDPSLSGDASLLFSTYLGGSYAEMAETLAIDSNDNIYVRGGTCSLDFPVTSSAFQSKRGGTTDTCDAFLTKLSSDGSKILYSTYLGGGAAEWGPDSEGSAGPLDALWRSIGFVSADILIYSSEYGGSFFGNGLAVDGSGCAYVTGATRSTDFPVTAGAYQTTGKGSLEAFLAKIDTTKSGSSSLVYSTLLGGSGLDRARAVAVDANGVAFVHGETKSINFPVTSDAIQPALGGGWDSFVSAISADGKSLLYSTYFGGSGDEQGLYGLRLDGKGGLYFGSASKSTNYPTTTGAYQATNKGGWDAVLTKIDLGPQIIAVVNAASSQGSSIAPSEFVSFYGANMGPATGVPSGAEVKGLGDVKVTFDDIEAFMTYASATQLNVVAPYKIAGTTNVRVTYGGNTSLPYPMPVADAAPGIFTQQYGVGQAWVVNAQDWTFNSTTNAAARESYIEFWATGQGLVTPGSADGAVIQNGAWPVPLLPVTVLIGGKEVTPIWVGLVYTGMIQVNVQVPADATTGGAVPLQVKIGNATSRADATVAIKPKP